MKQTGHYCNVEYGFDIDHEINEYCIILEQRILRDLKHYHKKDKEAIKLALIETIKEL